MTLPIRNARLRVSEGTLFWREVGHGQTVIFLHGSWQDSSQWLPIMQALSQEAHCLAPDLLGFGESSAAQGHYSIHLEVDCLEQMLDSLRLRSVYLVGHSLGAWVAVRFALRFPDRVKGLVLFAPEGVSSAALSGRWRWTRYLAGQWSAMALLIRLLSPVAKLLGKQDWIRDCQRLRRQLLASPAACRLLFKRRHAELEAERVDRDVSQLAVPLYLVQGAQDTPIAHALIHTYSGVAPQAILRTLPSGEDLLQNDVEAVVEVMRQVMGREVVEVG